LFAYLLVWMLELSSLRVSESAFDGLQEWSASLPGRLVACAVWLAAVFHALEGVRSVFASTGPSPAMADGVATTDPPHERSLASGVIAFLTWALVLPGWVLLLRPWLEDAVT
jgi:succinate dehydrogenase/fumarate reductase cytochrome b subunit